MDVTAVTTFLSGDLTTAITTVATAALIVIVGLKGWRYLRRSI